MSLDRSNLTQLLREGSAGDQTSFDQAIQLVYDELRRLARRHLQSQARGHTLQPTDLVHAAYLRLVSRSRPDWRDRAHFFAVAATMMRQILVDHARAKCASKRLGARARVEFNDALNYSDEKASELLAIDDGLIDLAAEDERKARTIELRYFGGLRSEEIAEVMSTSVATVGRDIRVAEAWLRRYLQGSR